MKKNNLNDFLQVFFEFVKNIFKNFLFSFKEKLEEFDTKYPHTSQVIQLSFIYFFAIVDLIYSILNNISSLGYFSENIVPFFEIINLIIQSPFFKVWSSPEKVFFMSYVVLELMVVKSVLKISKFIKYNILLVFSLLMLQGLVISFWDLLFHREISDAVSSWTYDDGLLISTNKKLGIFFFLLTFLFFIIIYYHFYSNALKGKIVTLTGLNWVTDSVAFWLKIKTPTMKFKERDKNKESEDDD